MGALQQASAAPVNSFDSGTLEQVFDRCFAITMRSCLRGGAEEPFYQPAEHPAGLHTLFYREDYFASALHEIAHWCIAGPERRRQVDFGYWYTPDGRSQTQQRAFEAVEYKPQAMEWFFCKACNYPFRISVDNLDAAGGNRPDTVAFGSRILAQARHWQAQGLPARADIFYRALQRQFGTGLSPAQLVFAATELQ